MASLTRIRVDTNNINAGAWVPVKIDSEAFEIKVRGITPRYRDRLSRLQQEAARKINRSRNPGDPSIQADELPPSVSEKCIAEAFTEECFIDVRGLKHSDDGPDVTADEFRAFLRNVDEYGMLLGVALGASNQVTMDRDAATKDAAGNSATVSAHT